MNAQEPDRQEDRLRAVLTAAYPSEEPTDAFRQRIQEHTARREEKTLRRTRRRRHIGLGLALAGATALVILGIVAWPTLVAAQTLRHMEAVMSDARSAHIILWNVAQNGVRTKSDETWYQAGKWRMERSNSQQIQIFSEGRLWAYDPATQEVRVQRRDGPFSYNPSGFSLGAYLHDVARWGWRDKIRVDSAITVDGRSVRQVTIDRDNERVLLLVDARTDLPFSLEAQRKTDRGFEPGMIGDIEYNAPLPASLFTPRFPKTARIVDLDHGKQDWQERLAPGVISRRVADRTLIIRDLQVNAEGDVFLLYTADKLPDDLKDWDVQITDEFGTRYLAQQDRFQPFTQFASADGPTKPGMWQGYTFDGVKLEGNWWAPATEQRPWKPRHFLLTFRVAPKNEHGGWTEMWGNARVGVVIRGKPEMPHTETVTITQAIDRPSCVLTPDYMPYMGWEGGGGLQGQDVLREDAQARLVDAWDQTQTQADQAENQQHDLPKALRLYQQSIQIEDELERTSGPHTPGTNTYAWFQIYGILREMGRLDEARAALLHSRDEALREHQAMHISSDNDPHWTQIETALKLEGIQ